MRKSTTRAFKDLVADYYNSIVTTPEEQEELHVAFWSYYSTHKNLELNHVRAFESFVNSCSTNFAFETYEQRELLKSWFAQTEAQSDKYSEDQISETFCTIIFREFDRRSQIK